MAEWRDRGFVLDSDDEFEDSASNNTQKESFIRPAAEEGFCYIDNLECEEITEDTQKNVSVVRHSHLGGEGATTLLSTDQTITLNQLEGLASPTSKAAIFNLPTRTDEDEEADELHDGFYKEIVPARYDACHKANLEDGGARQTQKAGDEPMGNAPSSPLTEPPSTPDFPFSFAGAITPGQLASECIGKPLERQESSSGLSQDPDRRDSHDVQPNEVIDAVRSTRVFRQRNPIQLHPYALEGERYRQVLKARGVKPLRIDTREGGEIGLEEQETNEQRLGSDDVSQSNLEYNSSQTALASSPLRAQVVTPQLSQRPQEHDLAMDEDDFPDLDKVLRQYPENVAAQGFKRRKIVQTFSRKIGHLPQTSNKPVIVEKPNQEDVNMSRDDADNVFDIPRSPPLSGSSTSPKLPAPPEDTFRFPRGISPRQLHTPVISSEINNSQVRVASPTDSDSGSESLDDEHARTEFQNDMSSSSESESTSQLQHVQRRIKGVLPASWLRLDLKTQVKKPTGNASRDYRCLSPVEEAAQLGVARPVPRSRMRRGSSMLGEEDETIVLSDGSSEDPKAASLSSIPHNDFGKLPLDNLTSLRRANDDNLVEDNRVDAMLQNINRRRRQPNSVRKRHSRPMRGKKNTSLFRSQPGNHRQQKITGHIRLFEPANRRPPMLSILDAGDLGKGKIKTVPPFLKLASRKARTRRDHGRHSPSHKFIRLATQDDTADANKTLYNWRKGTIVPVNPISSPSPMRPSYHRMPLAARSHNEQEPQKSISRKSADAQDVLPCKSISNTRQDSEVSKRKKQGSLLDYMIQRAATKVTLFQRQEMDGLQMPRWKNDGRNRGRIASSLQVTDTSRPAMLESLLGTKELNYSRNSISRGKSNTDSLRQNLKTPHLMLERYLGSMEDSSRIPKANDKERDKNIAPDGRTASDVIIDIAVPRARKRHPRRINVDTPMYKQPNVDIIIADEPAVSLPPGKQEKSALDGLSPFGTCYTTTFDIEPLPKDTFFHESTLLGSGDFQKSLEMGLPREFDHYAGVMALDFENKKMALGPWNEATASNLALLFDYVSNRLPVSRNDDTGFMTTWNSTHTIVSKLRSIVHFFNSYLSFLDSVDRVSCLQKCKHLISAIHSDLDDPLHPSQESEKTRATETIRIRVLTYILVIANQLLQLSKHELVDLSLQSEVNTLVFDIAQQLIATILSIGLVSVRESLRTIRQDMHDTGIQESEYLVEALVVVHHVSRKYSESSDNFWEHMRKGGLAIVKDINDARELDHHWHSLFSVVPILYFSPQGLLETSCEFRGSVGNWHIVKSLLGNIFDSYLGNSRGQRPTFNAYCRAILARCFHLIKQWCWQKCEIIVGALFDFFARNGLGHLNYEESHGSPRFLEHLKDTIALTIEPEDRCYQIFLKITGIGIRGMHQLYSPKKIRDIVWRLMPNHGRLHPKDEAIRQEDLDALRNHHDLLSVLYWASPPNFRFRLDVIRDLINMETSHREACQINIRAWSNLVQYQLSTYEPLKSLEPFADWHGSLLEQMLRQHHLARTEAETQYKAAVLAGSTAMSKDLLEFTVRKNQRSIESILGDALLSLRRAIEVSRSQDAAVTLCTRSLIKVFNLFDSRTPRTNSLIVDCLDSLLSLTTKVAVLDERNDTLDGNEDSQDYGDWSAFEENDAGKSQPNLMPISATYLHDVVHGPLSHLLSNIFGADVTPDEIILMRTVDAWVAVAQILVSHGLKSWNEYISQYGQDSWHFLRTTEHSRKYNAYYLASIVQKEPNCYKEHKAFFISSWVASIVERESLLKFQHQYTASILNADSENPILKNLPFWAGVKSGRFEVSIKDFCERRLSLISSLLSNIREHVEEESRHQPADAGCLKQEYRDLLKGLMATMKHHYEELGNLLSMRSTYVTFVQQVVEYMQQHTTDICPIDHFFTDSSAFPLPAADPTYVVGRLKNYGLRLQESRTPKQLVVFIQTVSERAAIDQQQPYLTGQLHSAMANSFEGDNTGRLTLRAFLIGAVFPVYIDVAFSTLNGWILAEPILSAMQKAFQDLLLDVDGISQASVASVADIIKMHFHSLQASMELLINHSGLLEQPHVLRTLASCFSVIIAVIPTLDYIIRLGAPVAPAALYVGFFKSLATFAAAIVLGYEGVQFRYSDASEEVLIDDATADVRQFASHELQDSLSKRWTLHDGRIYVAKGNLRKEIIVDCTLFENEKTRFIAQVERFFGLLRAMPSFCDEADDCGGFAGGCALSGVDELVF